MEIIDITNGIFTDKIYPDTPEAKSTFLKKISDNDLYNYSAFFASSHSGTHIDAPSHFIEDGNSVERIDLNSFIGPCKVIKVPNGPITGEYVENNFPRGCERLLIKSNGTASFFDHGAYCAINLGIKMIGIDSISISDDSCAMTVHKAFSASNIGILENLSLDDIEEGNYFLIALPIKSDGLEAAPARAILIKDSFSYHKR